MSKKVKISLLMQKKLPKPGLKCHPVFGSFYFKLIFIYYLIGFKQ